jgi:mRNA-degrading endonuclease HigB of HigAB toxin-antitoxin module
MAKMLDLNALDQPILEVKLRDDNRTVFRLTVPTVKQYERFISAKNEMSEIAKYQKPEQIKKIFELAAELISCNADYITVTAEELRDKYRLKFGDIVIIFAAYLDFTKEFNNAKN